MIISNWYCNPIIALSIITIQQLCMPTKSNDCLEKWAFLPCIPTNPLRYPLCHLPVTHNWCLSACLPRFGAAGCQGFLEQGGVVHCNDNRGAQSYHGWPHSSYLILLCPWYLLTLILLHLPALLYWHLYLHCMTRCGGVFTAGLCRGAVEHLCSVGPPWLIGFSAGSLLPAFLLVNSEAFVLVLCPVFYHTNSFVLCVALLGVCDPVHGVVLHTAGLDVLLFTLCVIVLQLMDVVVDHPEYCAALGALLLCLSCHQWTGGAQYK